MKNYRILVIFVQNLLKFGSDNLLVLCSLIQIVQMADWYRASASGSVDLGFDSESGQTNDFKTGIHSFPA